MAKKTADVDVKTKKKAKTADTNSKGYSETLDTSTQKRHDLDSYTSEVNHPVTETFLPEEYYEKLAKESSNGFSQTELDALSKVDDALALNKVNYDEVLELHKYDNLNFDDSLCSKLPSEQEMYEAVTEWSRMEQQLAPSKRQLEKFNTATVAYDSATGNYYYGMNRGVQISGDSLNPSLKSWLPESSLVDGYKLGNCAEVDAVNQALNAGAKVNDLHLYTLDVIYNKSKPMCANYRYTFLGRIAEVLGE